ncbi:Uncharacterised protein [Mycobacterium tuberculosis]|nr:Uncharacterised protein [Mycobacterium tuberculosis]
MWIRSIITSQDHGIKAHFITFTFHGKVDLCDDICLSLIKRNIVKTNMNSLVSIKTCNHHFLHFIS